MYLSLFFRRIALMLVMVLSFQVLVVPVAGAAMIATETMVGTGSATESRARLSTLLAREDVAGALKAHGVSSEEALLRVKSLTDQEVVKLSQTIDALPAAGDFGGLIGALVFVFLVLLFTDIVGLTDVYPFVKKR